MRVDTAIHLPALAARRSGHTSSVGRRHLLFPAVRLVLARYYNRAAPNDAGAARWGEAYSFLTFLSGCAWGAMGVLFFSRTDIFVMAFMTVVLAGVSSGSVGSLSSSRQAYAALALPTSLPFGIYAVLAGDQLISVLGILSLALLAANLGYSRNLHKTVRESVLMRFENLELIRQITLEKERAETANHAKSQFLAAASHDLRQPTHALGLFVATLRALTRHADLKHADVANIAARLQDALKNLGQLLNALLDVSRLDAGVVEAKLQPIAMQDVLSNIDNEFSEPARAKGLQFHVAPSALWVEADPVVLHRILSNLVSNALRYTRHGRVLIGCRRTRDTVEIQILDTGIGIDAVLFPKIFQEFYQVHNVARDREQGLGLGLSIVQRLVGLLGARLEVQSVVGRGSRFTVELPRTVARSALPLPAPTFAHLPQKHKTVLIIDDDRTVLDAVGLLLSSSGHTVISTLSLEQAIAAAAEHSMTIDLILADYRLAENVTGADAIHAVIARLGRAVPAVIITGDTSPDRIREASASGFRLMHKPIDPDQLLELSHA